MKIQTRKLIIYAILGAIGGLLMFFEFPILPSAPFLQYDPSDIPVIFSGFFFGPLSGIIVGLVKTLIFAISGKNSTGFVGLFAALAATWTLMLGVTLPYYFTKKKISLILGVFTGTLLITLVMTLLNYFVLLQAWGIEEAARMPMILSAILPFNLIKGFISSILGSLLFLGLKDRLKNFKQS